MISPEASIVILNEQLSRLKQSASTDDLRLLIKHVDNTALLFTVAVSRQHVPLSVGQLELERLRKMVQIESGLVGILGAPLPLSNDVLGQPNMVSSTFRFTQGRLFVEDSGIWIPRGGIYEDIDVPVRSVVYLVQPPENPRRNLLRR